MKKHTPPDWVVFAFCLISFLRGVYGLGEQSLWWDESLSHYRATKPIPFILSNRMTFTSGRQEIPATPDNHPPLYFVLLRLLILAAGDSEFAMRFLSLAAGVLIVPLLYRCGRRLFDPVSGTLAALFGALSPLYLWAQQEARPYALGTLLAVTSFYGLMRLLPAFPSGVPAQREGRQVGPAHRTAGSPPALWAQWRGGLAAYALATAAMIATHYHSLLLVPAQGIILLLSRDQKRRHMLRIWAIIGVLGAGAAWSALRWFPPRVEIPGYQFVPLATLLDDVLRSFPLGVSGTRLPPFQWIGVALLLAGLGLGLARPRRSSWRPTVYALLGAFLPIAEIYVLSFVRPAYMNIRHLIFASPFYYLLLASGIAQVRFLRRFALARPLALLGTGVLLVGMLLSTHVFYTDPHYAKEDHRGWGRYLSDHVRPDDLVLIHSGLVSELYFYYVESEAVWYGFPRFGVDPETTIAELEEIMYETDRVWVAYSSTPGWANPGNLTLNWLQQNAMRVTFESFRSPTTNVQAHAFRLRPPLVGRLPDDVHRPALDYGGQLYLVGLRSLMDRVEAGRMLQLSLYWRTARALERDYRVTLSLVDGAGFAWASLDYDLGLGDYPTSQWPSEQIVRDDVDLEIPPGVPPGRYLLNASVYPADHSTPALEVRGLESGELLGLIVPIGRAEVIRPKTPPPDHEVPVDYRTPRRYGDISLLGHNNEGGTYRPGDVILIDAYWRAIRPPQQDLTFSLGLVGEDGGRWGTREITPAGDHVPSQWSTREVVRGQYRFRIPIDAPPGQYALELTPAKKRLYAGLWPWGNRGVTLCALTIAPAKSDLSFEIPPMQHVMRASLNDQVELLGYTLASDTVHPGEVVSYTLYWRGLQDIGQNYTVFNHLVAPDGQTWGQWDNQPRRGTAPTTRWFPGQVIADPYEVPLSIDAPPGRLELHVGMYDLLNMARLPARDEHGTFIGDRVVLTEIEVTETQ